MPPLNLNDAEHLRQVMVEPLVTVLRSEMRELIRPLVTEMKELQRSKMEQINRLQQIETRLSSVERFKTRIAAVCSGIAVVLGIGWRMAIDWLKNRFFTVH